MTERTPRRRIGVGALSAVVVLLSIIGITIAWFVNRGNGTDDSRDFRLATPETRELGSAVLASGILRLKTGSEVRVGSQASGVVSELNVTVGSHVERGGVIARIDARGLEARLALAKAETRVASEDLRRATLELSRAESLARSGLAAARDIEDRKLDVARAEAQLLRAERSVAVVETDLGYTIIRSPISGTNASVSTQKGETVAASFATPTFATVIADGALQLVALTDETDIGRIANEAAVRFTVEAFPAEEFPGRVQSIAPKGVIIAGVVNYEVLIDIGPVPPALKPDMTANVQIQTASRKALMLPAAAVQRDGAQRYVTLDRKGEALRRNVTVGVRDGGWVEIRQGVSVTDTVRVIGDAEEPKP